MTDKNAGLWIVLILLFGWIAVGGTIENGADFCLPGMSCWEAYTRPDR